MLTRFLLMIFLLPITLPAAADLGPCTGEGLPTGSRCGTVPVPLHYEQPGTGAEGGGTLDLKVIVLPVRGGPPASDPVFYLVGGPGTAATESARFFRNSMTLVQATREVVLFDLRGTGASGNFQCATSPVDRRNVLFKFSLSDGLERCARTLGGRETLRTTVFAHDIDRVREAIGAEKVNLLGVSYGTRLALEYSRLYPQRVRASVLRGVTGPGAVSPAELLRGSRKEFEALAESHRGFSEAYARLFQRLQAEAATVRVGPEEVEVDGAAFEAAARLLLYSPATAASLPGLVQATAAGELAPLSQVVSGLDRTIGRFHLPVLLGVLCAEDVPFWKPTPTVGPFASAKLRKNALETCRRWSVPPVAATFREPVAVPVPTLLLSGAHDPATPAAGAAAIARNLPNSLHLVTPGVGHYPSWTDCHSRMIAAFFEKGSLRGLDVSCAAEAPAK